MRISVTALVLIPLLSGCGSPPQGDRAATPATLKQTEEERPANPAVGKLILVRAKVKSIDSVTPDDSSATLEIVHVYCGPTELKGRSFRDRHMRSYMSGHPARTPFEEIGEEGIWHIQSTENGLWVNYSYRLPFLGRSRKTDNRQHVQNVAFAESVEKYAKARREDLPALAAQLVRDATLNAGYWMVHTLGDTDEKFAAELLAKWRKNPGELPFLAQIALDKVLCDKEREDWYSAPERAELLKSWVSEKRPDSQASPILRRLDSDTLREDRLLALVRIAALHEGWSKVYRLDAVRLLARRRKVDPQPTYDWLFDQIRIHPDAEMRTMAAHVLGSLDFDAKLVQAVEDYLATEEKDATVIKTFRDAVKKAKETEKK